LGKADKNRLNTFHKKDHKGNSETKVYVQILSKHISHFIEEAGKEMKEQAYRARYEPKGRKSFIRPLKSMKSS
jgi:hypothetical protein